MSWISTWTGRQVYPLDPKPDQISIEDIAHGLSNKCRYNGQSIFYSVAEHSVHLTDWCLRRGHGDRGLAICALLHDAAEAYLPDITAPIKPLFKEFKGCEDKMLAVIFEALGTETCELYEKIIKDADRRICLNERDTVLPNHKPEIRWAVDDLNPLDGIEIFSWPPGEAYDNFMECYRELTEMQYNGF